MILAFFVDPSLKLDAEFRDILDLTIMMEMDDHNYDPKAQSVVSFLGSFRACADDIGAALGDIRGLVLAKDTFDAAKCCANLSLKPSKCVTSLTASAIASAHRFIGFCTSR